MSTDLSTPAVTNTPLAQRVSLVLLLTRLSIFIAMIIRVIDKFANPDHAAGVFEVYYLRDLDTRATVQ